MLAVLAALNESLGVWGQARRFGGTYLDSATIGESWYALKIRYRGVGHRNHPCWIEYDIQFEPHAGPSNAATSRGDRFPWTVAAIDPPFHLTFRRSDESLTDPQPVRWGAPANLFPKGEATIVWQADGRSFNVVGYPELHTIGPGRRWSWTNSARTTLLALPVTSAIAIVFLLVVFLGTAPGLWIHLQPYQCRECGYDLRGCEAVGCPECGWRRGVTPATRRS